MKITTVALFAVVALLVLPPLHAKPLDSNSLKNRLLSELLQRMIEEEQKVSIESFEEMDQNMAEEENFEAMINQEVNVCNTPEQLGKCSRKGSEHIYYYKDANVCITSLHSCDEGANNFKTILECQERCVKGAASGVTYIRWGHDSCPTDDQTVSRLYRGSVSGTFFNGKGGSANYLCLPDKPDYNKKMKTSPFKEVSLLSGTEYEEPLNAKDDSNVPCALCYDSEDNAEVMIPATTECPDGWKRQYYGYLMGPLSKEGRTTRDFICVDQEQKSFDDSTGNENGALLYHARASCRGLHCPPYTRDEVLTCVVCTK